MLHNANSVAVSPDGDVIVCDAGSDTFAPAVYSIKLLGGDRYDVSINDRASFSREDAIHRAHYAM